MKQTANGQVDLFGGILDDDPSVVQVPDLPEWTKRDLLANERDMLGLYVSDHPLAGQESMLMRNSDMGTIALKQSDIQDGETVTSGGPNHPGSAQGGSHQRKSVRADHLGRFFG